MEERYRGLMNKERGGYGINKQYNAGVGLHAIQYRGKEPSLASRETRRALIYFY